MNIAEQLQQKAAKLALLLPDVNRTYQLKEAGETFLLSARELESMSGYL
jgi:hypothetical protein